MSVLSHPAVMHVMCFSSCCKIRPSQFLLGLIIAASHELALNQSGAEASVIGIIGALGKGSMAFYRCSRALCETCRNTH